MVEPAPDSDDPTGEILPGERSAPRASEEADNADWQQVFDACEIGLRTFLRGKLPQHTDVDDCLQSVFMAMLNNRRPIPTVARRAWLFTVATREAARFWRDRSTTDRVLEKHATMQGSVGTNLESDLESQEMLHRLRHAIEKLPESSRIIVELRLRQEMTFAAIAEHLDVPLSTVLTRMRRALQRLRDELSERSPNDPQTHD